MVHAQFYTTYLLVSILALCAHAAPTRSHSPILSLRQADDKPFDGPKVVQTHNVTKVTGGNVVEDCTVTFTPIVVDGKNLVRQEKKCTRLFVPDGQSLPAPSAPANTDTPPATTTTAPPADTTTTSTTTASSDVSTTSADPAATTTTTTDGADTTTTDAGETTTSTDVPPTTTDTSTSSAPADTSSSDSAPASTDTPAAPSDPAASPTAPANASTSGGVIVLGTSTVPAEQNQGTAAAANESTPAPSSTDVVIPGKKFEVLPIGLGVFAGISVIALIVVGLVTYERTKYRKAFRQRRLAANGAEMGYGGMSERR